MSSIRVREFTYIRPEGTLRPPSPTASFHRLGTWNPRENYEIIFKQVIIANMKEQANFRNVLHSKEPVA